MIEGRDGGRSVVQNLIITDGSLNKGGNTSNRSLLVLKPLMYSWALAIFFV